MKNFNWRTFHGHHGSKRRELEQHAHSHGSHAFPHTPTSTQLTHGVRSASVAITEFGIHFNMKGPEGGGGANRSTRGKTPTACPLIGITYLEKIQRPGRESNRHPPTLVTSSLGQERAPRLTVCLFVCLFIEGL